MANIEMPQLGETVTEGTITKWFKDIGESVDADEVLFEVSTDKVDTEVPSPIAGTLSEIMVPEGETVEVGTVLAVVGDGASAPAEAAAPAAEAAPAPEPAPEPQSTPEPPAPAPERPQEKVQVEEVLEEADVVESATAGKVLSPVVRRLINEHGIDPDQVEGTGLGGRISRDDVQRYIEANKQSLNGSAPQQSAPAAAPAPAPAPQAQPVATAPKSTTPVPAPAPVPTPAAPVGARDTVVPLSNIRLRTAEHMVMSKTMSPHALTAIEVDYENVEQIRKTEGKDFKEKEGFSLTYLPFISRATIDALREYPNINSSVGDGELVVHNYINLAIAVDLDFQGLLAPVVHDADGKRMRMIARDISDVARRARSKQLAPDELSGGTFTITNAGSYGTMMQFPIINQPQVAILSTDAVKRKPVVIEDEFGNESIAIHSVGVLAMAWDHRAIDGAYAAAFMARVKDIIETRDWTSELA